MWSETVEEFRGRVESEILDEVLKLLDGAFKELKEQMDKETPTDQYIEEGRFDEADLIQHLVPHIIVMIEKKEKEIKKRVEGLKELK